MVYTEGPARARKHRLFLCCMIRYRYSRIRRFRHWTSRHQWCNLVLRRGGDYIFVYYEYRYITPKKLSKVSRVSCLVEKSMVRQLLYLQRKKKKVHGGIRRPNRQNATTRLRIYYNAFNSLTLYLKSSARNLEGVHVFFKIILAHSFYMVICIPFNNSYFTFLGRYILFTCFSPPFYIGANKWEYLCGGA